MGLKKVLIQASSRSWAGAPDLCMKTINNVTVFEMTLLKVLEIINQRFAITVIAPSFEAGGILQKIINLNPKIRDQVDLICSHDNSPLMRMYEATKDLNASDYIIRLDSLNLFSKLDLWNYVNQVIDRYVPDCLKFPDDFPPAFSFDVYKVEYIRELVDLAVDPVFHVHPKYYCLQENDFHAHTIDEGSINLTDDYLLASRKFMTTVYDGERMEVDEKKIVSSGDQLSFHYQLAGNYLDENDIVLDIACGNGYGARAVASKVKNIIGADIDEAVINKARELSKEYSNINFQVDDVTNLSFNDEIFDVVLSMETIEHVDVNKYCAEIFRVLKPGGRFIMSTPQNSYGHIPINSSHHTEFSANELKNLLGKYFILDRVIGIKQGRVVIEGETLGNNSFVVCKRRVTV